MSKAKAMEKNIDILKEYLEYRDGYIYWKKSISDKIKVGKMAGHLNKMGYWVVAINKVLLSMHRVIWIIENGPIPDGMVIDHINNNPSDNRIENLRLATLMQNGFNRKVASKRSKLGLPGISFYKKLKKYVVRISCGGSQIYVGRYETLEEAIIECRIARNYYHGEFASRFYSQGNSESPKS